VQSERVFLLFSSKLLLFSCNFFNLDAKFFGNRPFLIFGERLLGPRECSSRKSALSAYWQEGLSFPDLALHKSHFFLLKSLIIATTAFTLPFFAVSIAISLALIISLGAVAATLIGRGLVDE
jgi:hypothetical protein